MRTLRILLATVMIVGTTGAFAPDAPILSIEQDMLTITFQAGAIYECTHYENQSLIGDDGKLDTRHDCGFIDETLTRMDEKLLWASQRIAKGDYRIYADVGYPRKGDVGKGENADTTYVDYVTSNAIKVVNQ